MMDNRRCITPRQHHWSLPDGGEEVVLFSVCEYVFASHQRVSRNQPTNQTAARKINKLLLQPDIVSKKTKSVVEQMKEALNR